MLIILSHLWLLSLYKRREINPPGIGALLAYNPNCNAIVRGGWVCVFLSLIRQSVSHPIHNLTHMSSTVLYNGFLPRINSQYDIQQQHDGFYCVQMMCCIASESGGSSASCLQIECKS